MTWPEYDAACRGYRLRQAREWERTRQLGEWTAAFNGVDLRKELRGRRLLELPTDEPRQSPVKGGKGLKEYRDQRSAAQLARLQTQTPNEPTV
ncbi:hypothetical protein [Hymenobacter psychrophilus]|uniref:Uncharacterized protein n=1 Tax=Hymenobacter psychrophilus TaxID=651662 RepID=A0A1H3P8Q9_9BACT|nr:hypothetical protein [Hymenobacter psychrophilus]SDY97506.1 hypothetical protein SAMN04488069_1254 [Hymenobacter psychrophilus]